jgi:hypothetical protein
MENFSSKREKLDRTPFIKKICTRHIMNNTEKIFIQMMNEFSSDARAVDSTIEQWSATSCD